MSYKLKQESIKGFSEKAANAICDRFFSNEKRADGAALMKFTEVKQVNAFLVKTLFEKWQAETESLQSPYFDFDHKEVKEALKLFMNKLSEYISVKRKDLVPLLAEAIEDTVLITFDPVAYVDKVIAAAGSLSMKYVKTRKSSFKKLQSLSTVSADDFEAEPPVEPEAFVASLGMSLDGLFAEESRSFFDMDDEEEEDDVLIVVSDEPTAEAEPTPEPAPTPEPELATEPEAVEEEPVAVVEPEISVSAQEVVSENGNSETLNDRFNKPQKVETLADKLKKNNKQRLEDSLNLNEKIMFTNSLFEGDKAKLSEALADLEQAEDHEEAKLKAYKYSEHWDMESEEVEAFFEVIERRFA